MRLVLAVLCTLVVGCSGASGLSPLSTVSITNFARNSGGSGTVIKSTSSESVVLTNSHVCELTKHGGFVQSLMGEYPVVGIQQATTHDLCLVHVNADMGVSTPIASHAAPILSEALISGHPHLLPTIISVGNFSQRKEIAVLAGIRDCTDEDKKDPAMAFLCAFFGKLPIVKNYDSQVVGALIQPGSSGSGIYNENDELSAVVFAGSGDLGYGFAVPYEYVANFVFEEAKDIPVRLVDNTLELIKRDAPNSDKSLNSILQKCATPKTNKQAQVCRNILSASKKSDLIYREKK